MTALKLFLFGPPRLEHRGEAIEVSRRKAKALLAYLAVERQSQSRETLAALFWPDYDASRGRADLSRTLSVLNKALGPDWSLADRESVALNPEAELWVDIWQFQQLLAASAGHDHPQTELCPACLSSLTEAADLYQADFLAGFTLPGSPAFDEWQFFQTETLRQELSTALERLVRGYINQSEYELAIPHARHWLELDPLHEPAQRALMRLYAWTDQQAAALRQYQECVRLRLPT